MIFPFYQRVTPSNYLTKIGDFDIDPTFTEFSITVYKPGMTYREGPHVMLPPTDGQQVKYRKQVGEFFACFVAEVPVQVMHKLNVT